MASLPAQRELPIDKPTAEERKLVEEVSKIVHKAAGIQLGEKQMVMVAARLRKRFLDLGIESAKEYSEYLSKNTEAEITSLVSLLTTHHTFFFREFLHFEFLEKEGLPRIIAALRASGRKTVRIWSAACSRGQEAYSLAMFLDRHLKILAPELTFEILGTDVDPESVATANNGVYHWNEVKSSPSIYLADHWTRGSGDIADYVKSKKKLKSHLQFKTANLFDLKTIRSEKFDIIFCRNVFIYFEPSQISVITKNLLDRLEQNGFLFIGISENLNGLKLPISIQGPSIYGHIQKNLHLVPRSKASTQAVRMHPNEPTQIFPLSAPEAGPTRVICVDDSPTVLALLKKILSKENGFDVVGTATNGLQAIELTKQIQADIMTLDIHMPEMNGVDYLKSHWSEAHVPVVMISSVSREDASLGMKALELGAIDYVEKPTLDNLVEKSDEIQMKIRCAAHSRRNQKSDLRLERSFKRSGLTKFHDDQLRVILFGPADRKKVVDILRESSAHRPPTILMNHGPSSLTTELFAQLRKFTLTDEISEFSDPKLLKKDHFYIADYKSHFEIVRDSTAGRSVSLLLFSNATKPVLKSVESWKDAKVILEDSGLAPSGPELQKIKARCVHYVPHSSFLYHSDQDLSSGDR